MESKLAVLTGELREQYETDLSQGGILDTYEQVSATTSYEVVDVGLQQINEAQDTATLVVFGKYVVKSATTGQEPAPAGLRVRGEPRRGAGLHPDGRRWAWCRSTGSGRSTSSPLLTTS